MSQSNGYNSKLSGRNSTTPTAAITLQQKRRAEKFFSGFTSNSGVDS
jgi:hypothetical protein